LITWVLLEEERRRGRVSLRNFYVRRSLRIFPAFYVALVVIVVLVPSSWGPLTDAHVQSAALYYSNYYQAVHGSTHGALSHFWSLAVEEQFYVLWPGLFLLVPRHRALALMALVAAVWWQRYVVCWDEARLEWAYHALDCRADHVLVGGLVAVLVHEGRLTWLWRALCGRPFRMVLTSGVLVLLSVLPGFLGKEFRLGVAFYLEPWLISALLLQFVAYHGHRSTRWLSWRPLVWFGQVSYAVYLYHLLAMDLVGRLWPGSSGLVQFVPVLVLSGLMAQLSWMVIEQPAQRLRGRLSAASPPPGA
ncbi:MAG: acyltransferase, partial [Myxococcota bacterium]|nr:acyltransferase [Myxococcota bacterium]